MGETTAELMRTLAAKAVVLAAKSFETALDFSEFSVSALEGILESYHQSLLQSAPPEEQVRSMACLWGAYLGETLLRQGAAEAGYGWSSDGGEPVLLCGGGWQMSPVGKVERRLRCGVDENVKAFFDAALKIAAGEYPQL